MPCIKSLSLFVIINGKSVVVIDGDISIRLEKFFNDLKKEYKS